MQSLVPTAIADPSAIDPESLDSPDELARGACAGPWVIEHELGRGGMGTVYAVVHGDIGKRAALKVMHRRCSVVRILLEAKVVNQVGHPNIVDIFATGVLADGRPYIVMERLDGISLAQRAVEAKLSPDRVIAILLQVCDALIAAHAAGIIHRDLKLDNVFLIDNALAPQSPRVKVLDWGIAKVMHHDPHTTIDGQLVGTPQYLSPEQARGGEVSPATDVYSLGVMAYELFLEQLPFEAATSAELMVMHMHGIPPAPRELWPDIPRELEALMLAMLAKDPSARPSMLAVAHALERIGIALASQRQVISGLPTEPPRSTSCSWGSARLAYGSAGWRAPARRWPVWVGAIAFAASAVMYALARDHAGAAAHTDLAETPPAAPEPVLVVPAPILQVVQPVSAPPPLPVAPVRRLAPRPPSHVIDRAGPGSGLAPALRQAPAVRRQLAAPAVHHRPVAVEPGPSQELAAPRQVLALDVDGTIDPYR